MSHHDRARATQALALLLIVTLASGTISVMFKLGISGAGPLELAEQLRNARAVLLTAFGLMRLAGTAWIATCRERHVRSAARLTLLLGVAAWVLVRVLDLTLFQLGQSGTRSVPHATVILSEIGRVAIVVAACFAFLRTLARLTSAAGSPPNRAFFALLLSVVAINQCESIVWVSFSGGASRLVDSQLYLWVTKAISFADWVFNAIAIGLTLRAVRQPTRERVVPGTMD